MYVLRRHAYKRSFSGWERDWKRYFSPLSNLLGVALIKKGGRLTFIRLPLLREAEALRVSVGSSEA